MSLTLLLFACTGKPDDTGTIDDTAESDTDTDTDTNTDTDTDTPVEPSIAWIDDTLPVDLTPDGRTALLQVASSFEGEILRYDTVTGTSESVTTLGDASMDLATGIAADGTISALHDVPVQAGVWRDADGWTDLVSPFDAGCDVNIGGAWDLSDDGTVVVGLMWDGCAPAAFRWSADGMQVLDILGEAYKGSETPPTNRATVVSGDGQVIGGFAAYGALDRSPTRWTADGRGELLAPDDLEQTGEVLSIDQDGSTLGVLRGNDGYLWTVEAGFTSVGRLDTALPTDPVYVNALTADGAVAFGGVGSEFFTVPVAFVWTEADGMRSLQDVAIAAGVDVGDGYWLGSVTAVSDDGTVVLGRGYNPDFSPMAFVLTVPAGTW